MGAWRVVFRSIQTARLTVNVMRTTIVMAAVHVIRIVLCVRAIRPLPVRLVVFAMLIVRPVRVAMGARRAARRWTRIARLSVIATRTTIVTALVPATPTARSAPAIRRRPAAHRAVVTWTVRRSSRKLWPVDLPLVPFRASVRFCAGASTIWDKPSPPQVFLSSLRLERSTPADAKMTVRRCVGVMIQTVRPSLPPGLLTNSHVVTITRVDCAATGRSSVGAVMRMA